jgi:hypothetical protein
LWKKSRAAGQRFAVKNKTSRPPPGNCRPPLLSSRLFYCFLCAPYTV